MDKGGFGSTIPGYDIIMRTSSVYVELIDSPYSNYKTSSFGVLATGTTYFLFCSVNREDNFARAYRNGVQTGTSASLVGFNTVSNSSDLRLGVRGDTLGGYSNCIIDDARIYNRALSATEVLDIYNDDMSGRTLPVNISLGALIPSTTYYYRLVAS